MTHNISMIKSSLSAVIARSQILALNQGEKSGDISDKMIFHPTGSGELCFDELVKKYKYSESWSSVKKLTHNSLPELASHLAKAPFSRGSKKLTLNNGNQLVRSITLNDEHIKLFSRIVRIDDNDGDCLYFFYSHSNKPFQISGSFYYLIAFQFFSFYRFEDLQMISRDKHLQRVVNDNKRHI